MLFAALGAAQAQTPAYYPPDYAATIEASRNSFGLAEWWQTLKAKGEDGWSALRVLGPMNEKVAAGEYLVGIAVSGIMIFPHGPQVP